MRIVVGLGNPGDRYEYTYHNLGFLAIDVLAARLGISLTKKECDSLTAVKSIGGERVILAKPQTYMNLSGKAVRQLLGRYKADISDLIILYDDIDLERGSIRFRESGSAGTHNGMRDIISALGTEKIRRVRIGSGAVPEDIPLAAYVLAVMPDSERGIIAEGVKAAADKVMSLI